MTKCPQTSDPSVFKTANTALAAYLITEGYELADKDTSNPNEVLFIFDNGSPKLAELVRAFNMGTAVVNASIFYHNYRKLVAITQRERRLYGKA